MRAKRYLKDYQLTPEVDARGRLVSMPSYTGEYYRFLAEPDRLRRAKVFYLVLTLLALALFFGQLWYTDLFDREKRYLILPMSFNVIPSLGVVFGVFRFLAAPNRLTLRQRDRICNQLPAFSFAYFFLAVLAFVTTLIQLFMSEINTPLLLYSADAFALMLVTWQIFRLRRVLATEKMFDPINQQDE